jgi:glycosyltransferase involved in cell wall biosynthesis
LTISVIVPTYNGAHRILNVLRALEDQKVNDFELIVAIDGSNDDTLTVLNNSNFSFKNFRIIEQPNKGRASIRNLGAKNADGDLLIFTMMICVLHLIRLQNILIFIESMRIVYAVAFS